MKPVRNAPQVFTSASGALLKNQQLLLILDPQLHASVKAGILFRVLLSHFLDVALNFLESQNELVFHLGSLPGKDEKRAHDTHD